MRSGKQQQMEIKTNASATNSESSDAGNADDCFVSNINRRKNSFVWEYFRQIEDSKSFECIICKGCVGRQTSNLARHLAFSHNIKNQTVSTTGSGGKRGRPSKSFIWKFCTKQNEKYARCNLCHKLLYFGGGNTENIAKHLRRKHSNLMESEKTTEENISLSMETAESSDHKTFARNGISEMTPRYSQSSRERKERKGGSYVWNYCDKLSRHEIRCNLCNKMMSFHGTANVITHLQRKHNIVGKIGEERATLDSIVPDMSIDDEPRGHEDDLSFRQYRRSAATASIVWKYCTRVGRDVARCGFCKKNLSYQGTSNLQRHLHRMHGVVTQMRINKHVDEEFSENWKNINNNFIWQHCSVIDGEDDKAKCNLCNNEFDSKDTDGISKHLWASHGIAPKRRESTTKKRKRRSSETDDDSSSYENGDFDNDWSKQDYSNDAVAFSEPNIKKDESFFDEIIEEDPEHVNYEEEPFDPSMLHEVPLENPLSPHSSRAPSPATGRDTFKSKKLQKLNEEKVRMETEYFREKAGFYRMQKYLTALQAKKVRNELEQLSNAANADAVVRNNDLDITLPVGSNVNTQ